MIEPEVFHSNEQTLASNHYQSENDDALSLDEIKKRALLEFDNSKSEIEKNDLKVTSMKGIEECPDHIFPNWFITFDDLTVQLFSMKAENRRLEKTPEMVDFLKEKYDLAGDLSSFEEKDMFLEATSSMVFDRVNRVVYAGLSPRTNKELTEEEKDELETHSAKLSGLLLSGQLQSKSQKKRTLISSIVFLAVVVGLIVYFFFL